MLKATDLVGDNGIKDLFVHVPNSPLLSPPNQASFNVCSCLLKCYVSQGLPSGL